MPYSSIPHVWILFCACFGAMLIAMYMMGRQSRHLYTVVRKVRRRFSMMDLEFPLSYEEQRELVHGITNLTDDKEKTSSIKSLYQQILTDYLLYMPATYGGIFVLCYTLSCRTDMSIQGQCFFSVLAFVQILAFLLDAVENVVFLHTISLRYAPLKKTDADKRRYHRYHVWLRILECVKWGSALLGAACGFSMLCYYWLHGAYTDCAWITFLVLLGEIVLYGIISGWVARQDDIAQQKAVQAAIANLSKRSA